MVDYSIDSFGLESHFSVGFYTNSSSIRSALIYLYDTGFHKDYRLQSLKDQCQQKSQIY